MKRLLCALILCFIFPVLCFGAAATMYVTVDGAGTKDGSSWDNAFNYTNWEADVEGSAEAGDVYYVANGTYTLTSDFTTALDGTAVAPISIIGVIYNTTTTATGTDRPLLTDSTNSFAFDVDDYWIVKNMRFEQSDTTVVSIGLAGLVENCKSLNDSTSTNRSAFYSDSTRAQFVNNEGISTFGRAFFVAGISARIMYNYMHDSDVGIIMSNNAIEAVFNIIDTCKFGVLAGNGVLNILLEHNTIYNDNKADSGSIGIDVGTGAYAWTISHNIITGFETPIVFDDVSSNVGYMDYNDIYDCTNADTNYPNGVHDQAVDPQFTDAANANFDIGANLDDLGIDQPGDNSTSHLEIGAVMYEETAGGGGGGGAGHLLNF